MRVLFLLNTLGLDGPGVAHLNLLEQLIKNKETGIYSDIAALGESGGLLSHFQGYWFDNFEDISGFGFSTDYLSTLFKQNEYDVVVATLPKPEALARLTLQNKDKPKLIVWEHGTHAWDEKGLLKGIGFRTIRYKTSSVPKKYVVVSTDVKQKLMDKGEKSEKISIIYNPINTERFKYDKSKGIKLREKWGIERSAHVIGCSGTLREIKGQKILLEAFGKLINKENYSPMNNKVYLIFAGEGDDRNELELHAKKYGLSDIVNISGHMRYYDMPAFYSALNWYIQPSKYESFGQAACEAQACGIPTVVSDIGGLPEVVPAGFPNLVTEHTVEAWAEALRQMLEVDTSTRARWREAARQHVVDNFAPEKIAQQWIDLFHQVLGK